MLRVSLRMLKLQLTVLDVALRTQLLLLMHVRGARGSEEGGLLETARP